MRLVLVVPPSGNVAREQRVGLEGACALDVGGASDCFALVDHPSVGTARFRLEWQGPHLTVRDLEGLGKCFAGGIRLRAREPRIVAAFTMIHLGEIACQLELEPDAEPEEHATRSLALRYASGAGAHARARPVVRIAEGAPFGESVEIEEDRPRLVGRGPRADLFVDDLDVSREHVSVAWRDGRVLVTDLGSKGGTRLGGARLEPRRPAVWAPGRMLAIGKTVLLLEPTAREILARNAAALVSVAPSALDLEPSLDTPSADAPRSSGAPSAAASALPPGGAAAVETGDAPDDASEGAEHALGGAAAIVAAPAASPPPPAHRAVDAGTPAWLIAAFALLALAGVLAIGWLVLS